MRTDSFVDGKEVLSVVLDDVSSQMTFSCAEVKTCIEEGGGGGWKAQEDS